jgi:uncharacterized protein (DUF433 family)
MRTAKEKTVSARFLPADFDKLAAHARRHSTRPGSIVSVIVSRHLRALHHPAISFQETPDGGLCARLAGRRLSVWLVVEEVKRAGGKRKAAASLGIPEPLVLAALNYAAEYPDEIAEDRELGTRSLKALGLAEEDEA